mgnify:FL=1
MKTLIKNGQVYMNRHFEKKDLLLDDRRIAVIGDFLEPEDVDTTVYDAEGCYVTPGFIDVHTHGGFGVDVNAATQEDYEKIGHFFAKEGTTSWHCSILTDTEEQTDWCIKEAVKHHEANTEAGQPHGNCADLMGIHLEGPFLASEYKGAMPEYLLRTADMQLLKHYQETAGGFIHYITVSPEVAGIPEHVKDITEMGIKVAIGHSGADYATSWKCIDAGAAAATHTFNAMRLFHQHEPAIMGAVLESDVYCEAICDGRHLHPGSVRFLLKMKSYDRVIAITDSIMAAGLPDGNYKLGVNDVIVEEGDAKLKDGTRAGSTLTTGQAFRNLMKFTGESPEKILPLLTENPATMLGLQNSIGFIGEGRDADVLIMDSEFQIKDTFVKGRRIS